jgi:hypothetical protein
MPSTDGFNWYAKRKGHPDIPPLFGRPQPKNVDLPSYTPSNMWLVKEDEFGQRLESLRIQCVPDKLSVEPSSNWAIIPSIGRNNPFYHYTGGEDVLKFTLDWYSVHEYREDVIEKCRWVEALAKANAYYNKPPRVILIFGKLFQFDTWIVEAAPYQLSLFDRERDMLPRQAYQDLTLKKVTPKNTTTEDIRYSNGKPIFSSIS